MAEKLDLKALESLDEVGAELSKASVNKLYAAVLEIYIMGIEAGYWRERGSESDQENVKNRTREIMQALQEKTEEKVHIPLYIK